MTDPTKKWTPNQWVGYSIHNFATGWGSSIIANTDTTITTPAQTSSSIHTWSAGDPYQILKVYPCLDQPGRGQGDHLSGGGDAMPPTPLGWPHEALDPIYAWSNTFGGSAAPVITSKGSHAQANRDFYDWTANFDGTVGVGSGLLSNRPATCTPLVGYWAIDKDTLYQCSTKNNWTVHYTPYTYPHPLQGASTTPPTGLKVTGIH